MKQHWLNKQVNIWQPICNSVSQTFSEHVRTHLHTCGEKKDVHTYIKYAHAQTYILQIRHLHQVIHAFMFHVSFLQPPTHMYIYIYIYMHIYTHIHNHTLQVYIFNTPIFTFLFPACMYACIYVHTHTHAYVVYMYIYIYIYIYTLTHAHMCEYKHTLKNHTHIHTRQAYTPSTSMLTSELPQAILTHPAFNPSSGCHPSVSPCDGSGGILAPFLIPTTICFVPGLCVCVLDLCMSFERENTRFIPKYI